MLDKGRWIWTITLPLALASLLIGCTQPEVKPAPSATPEPSVTPAISTPSPTPTPSPAPTLTPTTTPLRPLALKPLWRYPAEEVVWDLATGDIDGDGKSEVVAGSQDKNVYLLTSGGALLWKYAARAAVYTVALADLEGDGQGEVIAGSDDNNIYALSADGRLLWRFTTGSRVTEVVAQDLDGDGGQEILAGSWDGYLYLLGGDGGLHWRTHLGGGATDIRVADLQKGGREEIIVASEEGGVAAFTSGGERLWSHQAGGYIRGIDLYGVEDKKIVVGSSEGVISLLSSEGQPLWRRDMGSSIPTLSTTEIEDSPKILLGSGYDDGQIYLLEEDSQEVRSFATGSGVWALEIFLLDGEEVIAAGGDGGTIYLWDRYGRLLGSYHVGGRIHGLLAHDLEGDGRPEIVLRSGLYLYALEITPGQEEVEASQITPYLSPAFSPSTQDDGLIELVAVGDILLSRTVEERMNQYGVGYPFAATGDLLRSADIALGNLECPLSTRGEPIEKRFLLRTHPRNLAALSWAGFDIVSLANNHLLDFGAEAMEDTLKGLKDRGVLYVGAGLSEEEAHRPVIMEVKGVKIAFLAYAAIRWRGSPEVPTETRVAFAEIDMVREGVRRAKEGADLVVVIMHLGTEYQSQPDAEQLAVAQTAIEAGATLVIGHHPHLVQETTPYLGGFIAYSLGDFVFDMPWEEEGAILRAFLTPDGLERAEIIPVEIVDGVQPRPLLDQKGDPVVHTVYSR